MDTPNVPHISSRLVYRANATAFAGGVIAGLCGTLVFAAARVSGITPYSFELNAGAWLTGSHIAAVSPSVWTMGFLAKLLISGVIGWLYSGGFRLLGRAGWDLGAAFGMIHWVIAGSVMGISTATGKLVQDPGYYGVNFGWPTFALLFFSHILFGVVVGGLYLPARARMTLEQEHERDKVFKKVA
jgi:hypothetical protein